MKTPLFFKLLLLLALGLRLLYAGRKKRSEIPKSYISLKDYVYEPIIQPKELNNHDSTLNQIKMVYRKSDRGNLSSKQELIIFLAAELEKAKRKGNLFRFIWHKNEYVIAFYESLIELQMLQEAHLQARAIEEYTLQKIGDLPAQTFEPESLFPDPQKSTRHWEEFVNQFDLNEFATRSLSYAFERKDSSD